MRGRERLLALIDKGRLGLNKGLSIGMPKLEDYMDGLTQETYYLLAGGTGSGKTSFALYSFVYKPLMDHIDDDRYRIIYFSLEMTEEQLLAKLLSLYIFETYGEEISFKNLLSRGKNETLSDEDYELVLESLDWLDKVESKIIIHDGTTNAERMKDLIISDLRQFGRFIDENTYELHNSSMVITILLDHIGLIRPAIGRSKKEEIDTASAYLVQFRNKCKVSPIVVMQVNRGSSNVERRKLGHQELQLDDLKDSGNPSEDSNVVIALFYPYREKMSTYRGYDIKQLEDSFRSAVILKNRFGAADIAVGTSFYGACGLFKELPKADTINDYEKYHNPLWLLESQLDFEKEEIKQHKDESCDIALTL